MLNLNFALTSSCIPWESNQWPWCCYSLCLSTLSLLLHWRWLTPSFTGCPWDQKLPIPSVTSAGSPKPQSISPCVCCAGELRGTVTLGLLYCTSSASPLIVLSRVYVTCFYVVLIPGAPAVGGQTGQCEQRGSADHHREVYLSSQV